MGYARLVYTVGIQGCIQVGGIQGYTGKPGIPTILNHGVYRGYTAQRVYRGYTARIPEEHDKHCWGVYRVYSHPSAHGPPQCQCPNRLCIAAHCSCCSWQQCLWQKLQRQGTATSGLQCTPPTLEWDGVCKLTARPK